MFNNRGGDGPLLMNGENRCSENEGMLNRTANLAALLGMDRVNRKNPATNEPSQGPAIKIASQSPHSWYFQRK